MRRWYKMKISFNDEKGGLENCLCLETAYDATLLNWYYLTGFLRFWEWGRVPCDRENRVILAHSGKSLKTIYYTYNQLNNILFRFLFTSLFPLISSLWIRALHIQTINLIFLWRSAANWKFLVTFWEKKILFGIRTGSL